MNTVGERLDKFKLNPPRVLALGFLALILIGAILLSLPIASKKGESIGVIDALFTATSIVCVTGLSLVNMAEHWSLFGQVVILILVQIGGLGFMTLATIVALLMGKRITLKERLMIKEELNQESISGMVKLIRYIILSTFIIEALGAIILSTVFIPQYGLTKGIWFSVFHSISAFCNAGIDILGNNMIPYVGNTIINITIALLVIVGGLGFSVYIDILNQKSFKKLHLHSKLVISISLILIISGMLIFYVIERDNPDTLLQLSQREKILSSFFQSVNTRSAGFYSVDINSLKDTTAFFMTILMFIGGSPGSTAGGIKTTTFGIVRLTRGITPNLSTIGKIIITVTIGRLGPLTMAFAFARKNKQYSYRYSEGNIIVG